jgi:pentatricopeptide repeat protein
MKADGVEPDIVTYTSMMDAHAKSKSPQKAEKVLYQLLDQIADSNDVGVSAVTCDTILNAWAQHGTKEGAERAQSILQKLEMWQQNDIRPTKFSYTTGTSL